MTIFILDFKLNRNQKSDSVKYFIGVWIDENLSWSTVNQKKLCKVEIKMNNIVCTITWNKKFTHVNQLYKKYNLLKVERCIQIRACKIHAHLHKLQNNKLHEN